MTEPYRRRQFWMPLRVAAAAAVAGALLLMTLATATAAPPAEFKLRIGTIAPEGTPWSDKLTAIKHAIERQAGSRIKVILYLGGRRGGGAELMDQLRRGKLQGAGLSAGEVAMVVPAFRVLELPYLFNTYEEVDYIIGEVIGKKLEEKALENGLHLAVWSENGWRSIGTKYKPVRTIEDVRGLKVRAQETDTNVWFWEALEARRVPIPIDEVLPALHTGVIHGFDQTPIFTASAGWYAQMQHYTLTRHSYQAAMIVYDNGFLESLPQDLRDIVLAASKSVTSGHLKTIREVNRDMIEEFRKNQIEVIELTDAERQRFREQAKIVHKRYRKNNDGQLLDEVLHELEAFRKQRGQ
ncbi:TRAP transporter substrate-binding protein [Planctomycetota bacterium]